MANGRVEETEKWIETASKFNNVHVPCHILTKKFDYGTAATVGDSGNRERITYLKYLSHYKLLSYTLIFLYLWLVYLNNSIDNYFMMEFMIKSYLHRW